MYNPACQACPLYLRACTVCLPGEGPVPSDLMVVGQSPGAQEDVRGRPFIGPSGEVLDSAFAASGLDRTKVFVTNAAKCHPGRERPSRTELATCSNLYLRQEIEKVRPKVILALGDDALLALTGESGIQSNRGKTFSLRPGLTVLGRDVPVLATYHPAYYLRAGQDPKVLQAIVADFVAAKALLAGQEPVRLNPHEGFIAVSGSEVLGLDVETIGFSSVLKVGTVATPNGTYQAFGAESMSLLPDTYAAWGAKFEVKVLGDRLVGAVHDPMLMLHLLDSSRKGRYNLEAAVIDEFGHADPEWLKIKHAVHAGMDVPPDRLEWYCACDSVYAVRLFNRFYPRLQEKPQLLAIYNTVVLPAMHLLARIEQQPVPLDVDYIRAVDDELASKVAECEGRMMEIAGLRVKPNFRSPKILVDILYKQLDLKVIRLTEKTHQPSTAKPVLMQLRKLSPFVNALLEQKRYGKLRSAYTQRWLKKLGLSEDTKKRVMV